MKDWTVKENARSTSICWTGKVVAKILHRRTHPDRALADAFYIVNACNYYHDIAMKRNQMVYD